MRLCLTCFHAWPADAQVCGACGRSFGGRACRHRGHPNPPDAHFCVRCGTDDLTEATNYISLGWLSHGLAWLIGIMGLLWLLRHLDLIVRILFGFIGWGLNNAPFADASAGWMGLLVTVLVFSFTIPGGRVVRTLCVRTGRGLWRIGCRVARGCFRVLRTIVEGRQRPQQRNH